MKKKILLVDDSALMRRVVCDIINSDDRFEVVDIATNGAEGFKYVVSREYDAVVLDVYMPKMTGLQMLQEMQNANIHANVMMASTATKEGARETLTALELGAVDFITKPEYVGDARNDRFREKFTSLLWTVSNAEHKANRPLKLGSHSLYENNPREISVPAPSQADATQHKPPVLRESHEPCNGKKIVAIASSTGGPRALQSVIPKIKKDIQAPILLVQHMPKDFTATLAERLDELSELEVEEANDHVRLQNGHLYVARGGTHLKVVNLNGLSYLQCSDEPPREGVKPCANYMFESLADSNFDEIVCVVLTGMGADGTVGIDNLSKQKNTYVIAQDEATSTVYGMPRSIASAGLANEIVPLDEVADRIMKEVGVH